MAPPGVPDEKPEARGGGDAAAGAHRLHEESLAGEAASPPAAEDLPETRDHNSGGTEAAGNVQRSTDVAAETDSAAEALKSQQHQQHAPDGAGEAAQQQEPVAAEATAEATVANVGVPRPSEAVQTLSGDGRGPEEAAAPGYGSSSLVPRGSSRLKTDLLAQLKSGENLHEADMYEELLQRVRQRKATQPPPLVVQLPCHQLRAHADDAASAAAEGGEEGFSAAAARRVVGTGPRGTMKREVIYERVVMEKETDDRAVRESAEGRRLRAAEPVPVKITCFKDDPEWAFQQFAGKDLDSEARFDDSLERLYAVKEAKSVLMQYRRSGGLFFSRETPRHRYARLLREVPEAIVDAKEFCSQLAALADQHRQQEAQLNGLGAPCVMRLTTALEKTGSELAEHVKRLFAAAAFPLDKPMGNRGFILSGIPDEEILTPLYCPSDGFPLQTLAAGARSVLCRRDAAQRKGRRRLLSVERRRGAAAHADAAAGASNYPRGASTSGDDFPAVVTDADRWLHEPPRAADAVGGPAAVRGSDYAPRAAAEPDGARAARSGEGHVGGGRNNESRQVTETREALAAGRDASAAEGAGNLETLLRIQDPARNVEAAAAELELRTQALQERLDALCRVVWGEQPTGEAAEVDAAVANNAAGGDSSATAPVSGVATAAGDAPASAAVAASGASDAVVHDAWAAVNGAAEPPVSSAVETASRHESESGTATGLETTFFEQDLATQLQQLHALAGGEISDEKLNGLEARLRLLSRQLEEQHDSLQLRSQERARYRQRQHQRESQALAEDELTALPDEWQPETLVQKMHEALAPLLLPLRTSEQVDRLHEKMSGAFVSQKQVVHLLLRLNRCEKQNSVVQASISASLQLLKTLSKANHSRKPGDERGLSRNFLDADNPMHKAEAGSGPAA